MKNAIEQRIYDHTPLRNAIHFSSGQANREKFDRLWNQPPSGECRFDSQASVRNRWGALASLSAAEGVEIQEEPVLNIRKLRCITRDGPHGGLAMT